MEPSIGALFFGVRRAEPRKKQRLTRSDMGRIGGVWADAVRDSAPFAWLLRESFRFLRQGGDAYLLFHWKHSIQPEWRV